MERISTTKSGAPTQPLLSIFSKSQTTHKSGYTTVYTWLSPFCGKRTSKGAVYSLHLLFFKKTNKAPCRLPEIS